MSEAAYSCWRCGAPVTTEAGRTYVLQCVRCAALQPPAPDLTAFQLLGQPLRYELDLNQLEQQYHQLSRIVHPDRFAASDERDRRLSLDWSTRLNEAYTVLKDPVRRAEYLLSLHGVPLAGESQMVMDAGFLDEQMDFRERLQEVRQGKDPLGALGDLRRDIRAVMLERAEGLRDALAGSRPSNPTGGARLVQELKFFNKLLQEADRIEEQFD